jgi:hypothetical protein
VFHKHFGGWRFEIGFGFLVNTVFIRIFNSGVFHKLFWMFENGIWLLVNTVFNRISNSGVFHRRVECLQFEFGF